MVRYYDSYYYTIESTGSKGFAIVTEICTEGDLQKYLDELQHHLEIEVRLRWYQQLADAVSYIHSKNICHRDLKPKNILISDNMRLKICDVGVAEAVWDGMQTTPGRQLNEHMTTVAGTKHYMAPEVWQGHYTNKCDIFSLGLVFIMIAESSAIGRVPTASQKKPLGQALSSSHKHPCDMISHSFQYTEMAEIQIFNKMLQFNPDSRLDIVTVEHEVQQISPALKSLERLTKNFDTAINGVIEFLNSDINGPSMDKLYHNVASVVDSGKSLKSIAPMPEFNKSIASINAAIYSINVAESVLKIEAVPGGDGRIDQLIEGCKQNPPKYGEIDRLFDATKLKAPFREINYKCIEAKNACTSAALTCRKLRDDFTHGRRERRMCLFPLCIYCLIFVTAIATIMLHVASLYVLNLPDDLITEFGVYIGLIVSIIITCCLFCQTMSTPSRINKYKDMEASFGNCEDKFNLLKQSSDRHLHASYHQIDQAERYSKEIKQSCGFERHISDHITKSLTKLKEGCKKPHAVLENSCEALYKKKILHKDKPD